MKAQRVNYVRLRTFVDPSAPTATTRPTASTTSLTPSRSASRSRTRKAWASCSDFHYSDNWADPGKQCVPVAWQSITTIAGMATAVHDYTKDAITLLIAGGARPDMVQIGTEETPGILIHLCDSRVLPLAGIAGNTGVTGALYHFSSTDTGAPPAGGPPAGGWNNLGMLLNARGGKGHQSGGRHRNQDRHPPRPRQRPGRRAATTCTNATAKGVPVRRLRRVLLRQRAGPTVRPASGRRRSARCRRSFRA